MNQAVMNGWLGFELGVLRRLRFSSVALPFTGEPELGIHLKRWKVPVATNDDMLWAYTKALALVENNTDQLSDEEIDQLLEDAYVPGDRLDNPALLHWFNESDAWWFDTLRFNAHHLENPYKRALALTIGMSVGDYVLSFDRETIQLRRPLSLSNIFREVAKMTPQPRDGSIQSKAFNEDTRSFLAERQHTHLLFLRLPAPVFQVEGAPEDLTSWREEWLRGSDDFWSELESQRAGRLGARVHSKQQYLGFVEDLLRTASHIHAWAIAHVENGFITTDELVERVGKLRKVDAIYSKDFSDLLGVRASIVTAIT